MQVVIRPHLLSTREQFTRYFSLGTTIAEMAECLGEIDPNVRRHNLAALVDGEMIPREQWETRRLLQTDQRVEFAIVLEGGGGRGKQILGIVAMIALTIMTGGAAAALAPGLAGMTGMELATATLVAKAGIMLVGSLLIHALFAPPRTPATSASNSSPTYSFSGQSNQPRRFARLPRIYGKYRYVADVAALPYTVNVGDDVYLYCLYCFGYGPLKLEDFRIGQNPLTNYSDYDIEVHENFTDASQLVLYKSDVWQDSLNLEVKQAVPVTVTTQDATESGVLDISFASGLVSTDDTGNQDYLESDMDFSYRKLGDTVWLPLQVTTASRGHTDYDLKFYLAEKYFPGIFVDYGSGAEFTQDGFPAGCNTFVGWAPVGLVPTPGTQMMVGSYKLVVDHVDARSDVNMSYDGRDYAPYTTYTTTGLPGDLPLNGDQIYQYAGASTVGGTGASRVHFKEKKAQPFTISVSFDFAVPGQYEIHVSKVEADYPDDDTKHAWRRFVTALRSMKTLSPLNPEVPITIVELMIKATGQLNGTIDQFSAIATSYLRQWDAPTNQWKVDLTRNPAWVYLDILQGTANTRPIPDARIDLQALKDWAVRCDQIDAPFTGQMGTCDVVVDKEYTVWDLMQNVATTGRAAPTMKDNKYSILLDGPDRIPVQVFTNRNSSGLKSSRSYQDEPHALRVQWIDALNNYIEAETIVYNTGHDALNTTVFEDLQSFGMTRAEQVLRWGRYMLAQAKLRQEHFSINVDVENIVCIRGDLVLVAHDVIQVGGDPTRIDEIDGTRLFVDAPPSRDVISDVTAYGVRIRRSDGYITPVLDLVSVGNDGELDYIDVAGDLTGITADNLVVLGPRSEVVGEYLVETITPGADLSATISLVELAPAIYNAEYTGLEQITYTPQGGGMLAPPVANLAVAITVVYDGNTPMGTVRASWRPAQGMPYQPEDYRVWLVSPTGNEEYLGVTQQLYWELPPVDITTLNGYTYTFRVRPFYGSRGLGPASETDLIVVYQPRLAPPLMDTFDVQNLGGGTRRYMWGFTGGVVPANVVGIQVRYLAGTVASPLWANGTDVVVGGNYVVHNGDEMQSPPGSGTFTFMARTLDDKGVLSTGQFVLVRTLTAAESVDLTPPPTPTGFTAAGGFGIVAFTVDPASYTMGGGHKYTQVYAAVKASGGAEPAFADAKAFSSFAGTAATAGAADATDYRFWAKWVTNQNMLSVNPAGPVATQTAINVAATVAALEGQIKSSSLDAALTSRITTVEAKGMTQPNLLPNGGFENGMVGWTSQVPGSVQRLMTYPGQGPMLLYLNFNTPGGGYAVYTDFIQIQALFTYTLSMDSQMVMNSGPGLIYCDVLFYAGDKTTLVQDGGQNSVTVQHGFASDDTWRAIHAFTYTAPATAVYAVVRIIFLGNFASVGVRQVKFEWGNHYTPYSSELTTVAQQTSIDSLGAQWTVKIDTNGYITGFGLATTLGGASPSSAFAVRADSFYIANPTGPGIAPSMPFIVRTTATVINGQTVPVGVYMTAAYIQNGTIDSAKIGLAVITDAHISSLNANKINAGQITAQYIDSRGLTIKDPAGNVIFSSGSSGVNFDTVGRPGLNYAPAFSRAWIIGADVGPVTSGIGGGLPYSHDGYYLVLNPPRGVYELAQSPFLYQVGGFPLAVSFFAYLNSPGTRTITADIVPGYSQPAGVNVSSQAIQRYTLPLVYDGSSSLTNAVMRIIGTAGPSVIIFDVQLEYGPPITAWKENFRDAPSPANPLTPATVAAFMAANTIATTYIADLAVSTAKIADLAVLSAKIGNLAVDTLKIADQAVTVPLGATSGGSQTIPVNTYIEAVETGYGFFSQPCPVSVSAVIEVSGIGSVYTDAFCSDTGGVVQAISLPYQTANNAYNPIPHMSMINLPNAGNWKFRMWVAASSNSPSSVQVGATIVAIGVKK